jgi:hypothetical protein
LKFSLEAFENAVAAHLSPRAARDVIAALKALRDGADAPTLTHKEAGNILARIVCPVGETQNPATVPLSHVEPASDLTGGVTLDADDAALHPLLREWVGLTLAEAIAAPILAGVALTNLSDGAPVFKGVEITLEPGDAYVRRAARAEQPQPEPDGTEQTTGAM